MEKLKIGQVAKLGSVNIETIRFYERKGLISPVGRMESGYRLFTEETVKRILFIKHAKELGFTLKEIGELLSLRVRPKAKCEDIKKRAIRKIKDVEAKIAILNNIRKILNDLTNSCESNKPTSECPILKSLE